MSNLKVVILGTGPSAAYAVMACIKLRVEYEIISNRGPTINFPGAFWPRLNPTSIPLESRTINVYSIGTAQNYLAKQWGEVRSEWLESTSFPVNSREEVAYDPYLLFGEFWKHEDIRIMGNLSDYIIKDLVTEFDLAFMTFATEKSKKVMEPYVIRYPIVSHPIIGKLDDSTSLFCLYNGSGYNHIVRLSKLFGFVHAEYGKDYVLKQELVGDGKITYVPDTWPNAPIWDPSDVPAKNVILVGRFAQWDRKVLSHNAYEFVLTKLQEFA